VPLAVHRGRWTPADRAGEIYRELPFELPAGAPGVTATLRYDRRAGVLDLGCFGPAWDGPVGAGPAGFRGWSGGARDTFTVAPDRATPGYLAGPLPAGEWRVCLGLHRIPADGLDYEVIVELGGTVPAAPPPPPVPAERPPRRELPAEPGRRWLAGDLHSHTVHSDGELTIDELACRAAAGGLDFLAVTDHNTVSHHPLLAAAGRRAGVLLLPGQEVTRDIGHAGAFGDIGWIDFRRPADDWLTQVTERGGLLSVNHPLSGDCSWRHPMTGRPPLAEIWHRTWSDRSWGGPLAWWQAWHPGALPVGGSDFHRPADGNPLGTPTTWVQCAGQSVPDVLGALAEGRISISADRDAPVLLRVGDELVALDADGSYLVDREGGRRVVQGDRRSLPAGPGPYRLEAPDNTVLALCA
jgi:hypothetical protein